LFWDAVNEYASSCGGDTGVGTVGDRRMNAVVGVERAFEAMAARLLAIARAAVAVVPDERFRAELTAELDRLTTSGEG
jgi:hypothetical protein